MNWSRFLPKFKLPKAPIIAPDRRSPTYLVNPDLQSWSTALSAMFLGLLFLACPIDWFGPSWSFWPQFRGGELTGWICLAIGWHQTILLYMHARTNLIGYSFLLGGFFYSAVGCLILKAGLSGHQGLMEAPLFIMVAMQKFIHGANLLAIYGDRRRDGQLTDVLNDHHRVGDDE